MVPIVSVVVCTLKRSDLLRTCLQSLSLQSFPRKSFEVLVVDNAGDDETLQVTNDFIKQGLPVDYVYEPRLGLSYARNTGFRRSQGAYVAFIDDDAQADPQWLTTIHECFSDVQPQPVAIGGPIVPWYKGPLPDWFTDNLETRTWGEQARFLNEKERYGFSGSNMAFKRDILQTFAGFTPRLGMRGQAMGLGEEADLFRRIWLNYPLFWYSPSAKVSHLVTSQHAQLWYRFRRGVLAGCSKAYMDEKQFISKAYGKEWVTYLRWLAKSSMLVLQQQPQKKRSELALRIMRAGHQLGYLIGRFHI